MQYWFHSNTNATDTPTRRGFVYLGNAWYPTAGWVHFSRDVAADFTSLWPSESLTKINAVWLTAEDVYVDDMTASAAGWSATRHAGAEWTPGAASWPSGGVAKDVAVYNHYDHLGNLAVRTDATGASVATWTYDAFGNVIATTGTATAANYRHTGNHYDPDAGLFYFNNRWYDARLGRFTQRHTPFQPLSEHPYAISEGNPAAFTDRAGLAPGDWWDLGGNIYATFNSDWYQWDPSLHAPVLTRPDGVTRPSNQRDLVSEFQLVSGKGLLSKAMVAGRQALLKVPRIVNHIVKDAAGLNFRPSYDFGSCGDAAYAFRRDHSDTAEFIVMMATLKGGGYEHTAAVYVPRGASAGAIGGDWLVVDPFFGYVETLGTWRSRFPAMQFQLDHFQALTPNINTFDGWIVKGWRGVKQWF